MFGTILRLKTLAPDISMGPGVYFFHSYALPSIYLSPCVYLSPALTSINTVHVHMITMHKYKTIMTVLIASVQQIMHVSFVRNVVGVRFFSSRAYEFLIQENFC